MTTTESVYSRIERREMASPRSAAAITLAVMVIALCVYAAIETVLGMTGQPALLAQPADMAGALVNIPASPLWLLLLIGIATAIIGAILIVVALTPGWRARHKLPTGRVVTIVDDEVIASALARHASYEGNVDPDSANVSISRRRAVVTLTATSGTTVNTTPVKEAVSRELESYGLTPRVSSKITLGSQRKVGA